MKILNSFCLIIFICFTNLYSQQLIEGEFEFQTDPAKKYAIYIPSSYDVNNEHELMVGLHPFNTSRWDAISWRDTLVQFAETNNLILLCPDGGPDGRIDDPIDTAFTTAIIDSMELWYNIDTDRKYLMGFSWGGKTTYTYGLRRTKEFAGFLPIGAAINESEFSEIIESSSNENFYLVHGSNDSPNLRYYPALEALQESGACVESVLMNGIGHTIDFPNRNEILTEAFQFISQNNCSLSNTQEIEIIETPIFIPTNINNQFVIKSDDAKIKIKNVLNIDGTKCGFTFEENYLTINTTYIHQIVIVSYTMHGKLYTKKLSLF